MTTDERRPDDQAPDEHDPEARPRHPRRVTLLVLAVIAITTPIAANLATPDAERRFIGSDIDGLPYIDGYIKEATSRRVVVEREDGIFQNLETRGYVSSEDIAHMQDHSRYGTATRLPYVTRAGRNYAVAVKDLEGFPGVDRPAPRTASRDDLAKVDEGESVSDVTRVLGTPLEVRFDHTAERDCWRWPTTSGDRARAEVCFTPDSHPKVIRVRMVDR